MRLADNAVEISSIEIHSPRVRDGNVETEKIGRETVNNQQALKEILPRSFPENINYVAFFLHSCWKLLPSQLNKKINIFNVDYLQLVYPLFLSNEQSVIHFTINSVLNSMK